MILRRRIENLESAWNSRDGFAYCREIESIKRRFAAMSDEELDAMIAEAETLPSDPELEARLAQMSDDELCRLILDSERVG